MANNRTAITAGELASNWLIASSPSESKLGNQDWTSAINALTTRGIIIPPIIASLYGDSATFLFNQFTNKDSFEVSRPLL